MLKVNFKILGKGLTQLTAIMSFTILGCQADPSAFKIPVPDIQKVNKSFAETYNPAVDILFIVDDSGSMNEFQQQLALNADLFINEFFNAKFIDYHIGVTTSSGAYFGGAGKLKNVGGTRFVERNTPNGEQVLAELLAVGTTGSGTEYFLSIIQEGLSASALKTYNKGFFREEAQLAVFVVTDTEDQSSASPEDTYKFLLDLKKGDSRKIHFAGAIVTIEKAKCVGETDQGVPYKLRKMVNLFQSQGYRFNICKSNFGEDIARVATQIVNSVSTIYLDNLPDINSLEVSYGGELLPNNQSGWVYDFSRNAIRLSPSIDLAVGVGKNLDVRYEEIYKPEEIK